MVLDQTRLGPRFVSGAVRNRVRSSTKIRVRVRVRVRVKAQSRVRVKIGSTAA